MTKTIQKQSKNFVLPRVLVVTVVVMGLCGHFFDVYAGEGGSMLHIEMIPEGMYDRFTGKLRPAHKSIEDGPPVPVFGSEVADRITVRLHRTVDYAIYEWDEWIVYQTDAYIDTDGNAWIELPGNVDGEPLNDCYWLSVNHRNHLETIYHSPLCLNSKEIHHCDFVTGSDKENNALGNNQQYLGEVPRNGETVDAWAFFAGDINGTYLR